MTQGGSYKSQPMQWPVCSDTENHVADANRVSDYHSLPINNKVFRLQIGEIFVICGIDAVIYGAHFL